MAAEEEEPRIAVVVPTITADHLRRALPWLQRLRDAGAVPVVAANSAAAAAVPLPAGLIRSADGTNPGFARSVNRGARDAGDWDWLLVLNDDLKLADDVVDAIVEAMRDADPAALTLLLFDPEPPRSIPSRVETVVGLSLLGEVPGRLQRAAPEHRPATSGVLPAGRFKSFSAVAISRGSWQQVGTLSETFLFCYEDAEYARRFAAAGGRAVAVPVAIRHDRSRSTKSRIRVVLPAIAESATAYLVSSGVPRPLARGLTALALVVRVPMVLGASAPRVQHLRGIAAGIRLALTGGRAALPPFGGSSQRVP